MTENFPPPSRPEVMPETNAQKARRIGRLSTRDAWEFIRPELHAMILQRLPLIDIAEHFDVHVMTIRRWRERMRDEMRREADNLQPRDFVMDTLQFHDEVRAIALRNVRDAETRKDKIGFLNAAIRNEADRAKFGALIGLYGGRGDRPLQPDGDNADPSGRMAELQSIAVHLLTGKPLEDCGKHEHDVDDNCDFAELLPDEGRTESELEEPHIAVRRRAPPRSQ